MEEPNQSSRTLSQFDMAEKSLGRHADKSPKHQKETHGTSDDIDETTPVDKVKGPGVFERMKEEVEAIVEAIHPKKESSSHDSWPK